MKRALWVTLGLILSQLFLSPAWALQLTIIDKLGNPCVSCQVHVGSAPNNPFLNNWGATDDKGKINFSAWPKILNLPVTILSPLRPLVTYLNQSGTDLTLKLPDPTTLPTLQATGSFNGWSNPGAGNNLTFGIVIPLIDPEKIFELQAADILSPQSDTISIYGKKINIPSNISLPNQTLHYGIFPVKLSKPQYRIAIPNATTFSLVGVTGSFPFSEAINMSSSGAFDFNVLNKMTFDAESTIVNQSTTQSNLGAANFTVGTLPLSQCLQARMNNAPSGYQIVGAALHQNPNYFQVTDLKLLSPSPLNLRCLSGDSYKNMSFLALGLPVQASNNLTADTAITAILNRSLTASQANMNSFFNVPSLVLSNSGKVVSFTRVEQPDVSPNGIAYYAVLSQTQTFAGSEISTPTWIFISQADQASNSTNSFEVPSIPFSSNFETITTNQKNRWDLTWLGIDPNISPVSANIDITLFEVATHASRNSIEF